MMKFNAGGSCIDTYIKTIIGYILLLLYTLALIDLIKIKLRAHKCTLVEVNLTDFFKRVL